MHTLRWLMPASSIAVACAPAVTTTHRKLVLVEQATWQARAAFDSAARAGDTLGLAAVFAEDALLISEAGDSIWGREAIGNYLAQLVPGAISADFSFVREGALEQCRGGARERISFAAHVDYRSRAAEAVSGNLVAFWKRDSAGVPKVAWAVFSRREIQHRLRPSECPSLDDSIWRAWRLAFTLYPVPVGAAIESNGSFARILRARGWVDVCACGGIDPIPTPVSQSTPRLAPGLLTVQYHLRHHVIAEVLGGRLPSGSTMGAQLLSNGDYAQTRLFYSGAFLGALLSYDQWGIQVGVGPVWQIAHWRLRDSVIPYGTGGYTSFTDRTWSSYPVGVIGDARFHRLLGSHLFFAVRAQVRRFRNVQTKITPRFPPATVDQGSSFIGVGWGMVF